MSAENRNLVRDFCTAAWSRWDVDELLGVFTAARRPLFRGV